MKEKETKLDAENLKILNNLLQILNKEWKDEIKRMQTFDHKVASALKDCDFISLELK